MSEAADRWLFDLGNSRLKFARLRADGGIGDVTALAHDDWSGAPDAAALPHGDVACVAAVAPSELRERLLAALRPRFGRVSTARTEPRWGELRIAYDRPEQLGVDRFLAMVAAHARGGAALVVGVGTALTIDLVDAEGRHRGGRIAPSPELMRAALHARVSQLPPDGGAYEEFAGDTSDALASGCEGATLALVERSVSHAERMLGVHPRLLLHGGGAGFLHASLPDAESAPALVLEGLARWAAQLQ